MIDVGEATRPAGHDGGYFVDRVTASPPARDGVATVPVEALMPPRATGELTTAERLFQGRWQSYVYASDTRDWIIEIDGRDFRAEGRGDEWYTGYVTIRPGASPAQIDFTIEGCDCNYIGSTSRGVYYEDEGSIVMASPPPGDPRPEGFEEEGAMLRLRPLESPDPRDGEPGPDREN
jgi:hypothetical protein